MSESSTHPISLQDVRRMIHLLGEIAGMTTSIPVRRNALMSGLLELVDADAWVWAHARYDPQRKEPTLFSFLHGGWSGDAEVAQLFESSTTPRINELTFNALVEGEQVSLSRVEMMPDEIWDRDPAVRRMAERLHLGDLIISSYPLSRNVVSLMSLNRRRGKPPFSERDRCIIHLILSQIDMLHRADTDVPGNNDQLLQLPPRQREFLLHMLSGASRKEIATRMGLSIHTISDYAKALHKRFEVSTRSELLRKFMSGASLPLPPQRAENH